MRKEQNYASLILLEEDISQERFHLLESWLYSRYEYAEIILLCKKNITTDIIKERLQPQSDNTLCLFFGENHSLDAIIRSGLEFSKGDVVFAVKKSQLPNIISRLDIAIEANKKGGDSYFIGSSYTKRDQSFLHWIEYFAHTALPSMYDSVLLLSRRVINALSQTKSRTLPLSAVIRRTGYSFEELLCTDAQRQSLQKNEKHVYMMMFSDLMPRLSSYIAGSCTFISFLAGLYAIILHLFAKKPVEGWTTTFLFLSFGFSAIFMFFTAILTYISVLAEEIYEAPHFRVHSVIKLGASLTSTNVKNYYNREI